MTQDTVYDAVILGAGLVGCVAALSLIDQGVRVAVVEERSLTTEPHGASQDTRTTAISYGSMLILKKVGVWDDLAHHAGPISRICTLESGMPFTLNFEDDTALNAPMGFMISNEVLRRVLLRAVQKRANDYPNVCRILDGVTLTSLQKGTAYHTLTLSSQHTLCGRLILGSEGRHSPSRSLFGITASVREYGQTAMVCFVRHEKPHNDTAFEIFHPTGPLAFLPMPSCESARENGTVSMHRSAIVWSCAEPLNMMDHKMITEKLYQAFDSLGPLEMASEPSFYPLTYQKTSSYVSDRYALLGDAAHVMHPVAGQGVNLGWRDADVLCGLIHQSISRGLDIGCDTLLQTYNTHRRKDQLPMMYVTHSLIKLFGIEPKGPITQGIRMLRAYGLGLVNRLPPLKHFLRKKAMGI